MLNLGVCRLWGEEQEAGGSVLSKGNDALKALEARRRDQEEASVLAGGRGWSNPQWLDREGLVNPAKESGVRPEGIGEPASGFKLGIVIIIFAS